MNQKELFASLDGLFAHDGGASDSGISDETLRLKVKEYLHSLDEKSFRVILTGFIREYYVSKESVELGYGIEDVASFIRWLSDRMSIDI